MQRITKNSIYPYTIIFRKGWDKMINEEIKTLLTLGIEANKDANKSLNSLYDEIATLDINNDLEMLRFKYKKSNCNATSAYNNGIKRLLNKKINEEIKAIKESK